MFHHVPQFVCQERQELFFGHYRNDRFGMLLGMPGQMRLEHALQSALPMGVREKGADRFHESRQSALRSRNEVEKYQVERTGSGESAAKRPGRKRNDYAGTLSIHLAMHPAAEQDRTARQLVFNTKSIRRSLRCRTAVERTRL